VRRRLPRHKGLGVRRVMGLAVVIGLSSRRSRCYGDGKNEEDTNELDKDFSEHDCNVGCGVRQEKV